MDILSLGMWIKRRRKALDLTQQELAQRVGCSWETIRKIEADVRRPSRQIAELLAEHLALPLGEREDFVRCARAELAVDRLLPPAETVPSPAFVPATFGSQHAPDLPRTNLPAQPTALIGREREIAAVSALLRRDDVRLLTLSGPGGTGKTRLALQAAAELLNAFPNGVWFVNLAPISDVGLVAATIAQALGMLEAGTQPLIARLQSYLHAKQLLLLLDNFEHVAEAAPVIAALLVAAPGLTVLVTSRTVLHLAGEHEFGVPPLAVPDLAHLPAANQLTDYAAVRLFVDRAQAARADFQVTNANAPAVAAICARLDGLPLAIELAAARVKLFAPQALLPRLDNRMKFLSGGARDLPARQRTLRDTIAWSYDLLNEGEKTLFGRLGVFVGGCTLEAAEAVCNTNGGLPMAVLDDLALLVDKSLLDQRYGVDGEPRFLMLETIREYALEQLVSGGAAPSARQQHAAYYLALAERAEPGLRGPAQRAWLDQLELEVGNLRAALQWALAQGVIEIVARLGVALARFWEWRDHLQEGIRWLEAVLQQGAALEMPLRAAALRVVARLYSRNRIFPNVDQAERYLRESLALLETLGDQRELARVRAELGWLLVCERGDWAQATPLLESSLALGRALDEPAICAWALDGLGMVARTRGDLAAARASFVESLALRRTLGDQAGITWGFFRFGDLALAQGDYTEAYTCFTQRLTLEQALAHKAGIASSLSYVGEVAMIQRQLDTAAAYLAASLEVARDIGDTPNIVFTLDRLSILAMEQGDLAGAQAGIEEGLALWRELDGGTDYAARLLIIRGDVAALRGDVAAARASYEESLACCQELGPPFQCSDNAGRPLLRLGMLEHEDAVQATALLGESLRLVYPQKEPVLMALALAALAGICPVPERGARLAGAATALLESVHGYERLWPIDRTSYDRTLQSVRNRLEPAVLARAWAIGQALPLEQAIAEALGEYA